MNSFVSPLFSRSNTHTCITLRIRFLFLPCSLARCFVVDEYFFLLLLVVRFFFLHDDERRKYIISKVSRALVTRCLSKFLFLCLRIEMKAEPLRMLPRFHSTSTTSSVEDAEPVDQMRTDDDFLTLQTFSCPQLASSTRSGRRVKYRDENQSAEGGVTASEMKLLTAIDTETTDSQHLLRS